jgi:hypothetical protein
MSLKDTLSGYWLHVQEELLPWLNDTTCGPLNEHHNQLVAVPGVARIEAFLPGRAGLPGRPLSERTALARAFVAKAVFNFSTTRLLIEMLSVDKTLRGLCGWQRADEVPSEATFSRAFAEFAASALPSRLHEALIEDTHANRLVGYTSLATARRSRPVKSRRNQTHRQRNQNPNTSVAGPARERTGPRRRRAGSSASGA